MSASSSSVVSILADDAIPYLHSTFRDAKVARLPGQQISMTDLEGIDALLLRTVTAVDRSLLENSSIRCVATASAGFDHFNLADLKRLNISWYAAKGCNASAVAEYVVAVVALLQSQGKLEPDAKVGVIGVGHVGKKVAELLSIIGLTPVRYDPPRELRDASFKSAKLCELDSCQMLSCHLPLVREGEHATVHFLDQLLDRLEDGSIILNAGRGESLSLSAINKYSQHRYILDVWETEPSLAALSLESVELITPHIAGYGVMGKYNATTMAASWLAKTLDTTYQPMALPEVKPLDASGASLWQQVVLAAYDPRVDDAKVRSLLVESQTIEPLRKNYALRAPFDRKLVIGALSLSDRRILSALGFKIRPE